MSLVIGSIKSWQQTVIFTDELLIEDAAYTMAKGGSWITPKVNGETYLAKPPLLYWLYALLYRFFPPLPFIRRVWMIIFGSLLNLIVFVLAKKWYGVKVAVYSSLFLCLSFPFVYFTKTANFDLVNAFFITLTVFFYNQSRSRVRYFFTFISLGVSVLNRSFLALLPFAIIGINETVGKRRFFDIKKLILAVIIFLLIILPWHILAVKQDYREFVRQYLQLPVLFHMFSLVDGDTASNPLFYLNIFVLFPPVLFVFLYLGYLIKFKKMNLRNIFSFPHIQLSAWIIFYSVILAVSRTRHEWYLLPLFPALAIATGYSFYKLLALSKGFAVANYFFSLMAVTFLISPVFALIKFPLPEAEVIQAVNLIKKSQAHNSTFFIYKYDIVPITGLYPENIKGKIIKNLEILDGLGDKVNIIARTADLSEFPEKNNKQIKYRGELYSVVSYN